jgi:hypothetical protein
MERQNIMVMMEQSHLPDGGMGSREREQEGARPKIHSANYHPTSPEGSPPTVQFHYLTTVHSSFESISGLNH